jgi:hypothetical protein
MKRLILITLFTLTTAIFLQAQEGSVPSSDSIAIIRRLSLENFRNIKILTPAIMNYGGGEEEFDRLVKTYSEASSLYFSREYEKAAKKFQENEKQIREVATELAQKYKEDTSSFQEDILARDVQKKIKQELEGDTYNPSKALVINQSSAAIIEANDYFDRVRPIQAIEYYRISREKMLQYLYLEADELPDDIVQKCREDMYTYDVCIKKAKNDRRAEVKSQYEKLISDTNNEVHIQREKEN